MFKFIIIATILIAYTYAGVIDHHYEHEEPSSETDHHSEIEHKHATSHQSFKIHHFHAVPTYIKKEDQQFLKHPVEVSGIKHNLKIVHPETEHHGGHGLTLENHQEFEDKSLGGHGGHGEHGSEYSYEGHGHESGGDYGGHHSYGHE